MPDWLVERGIGETRSILVDHGEIIEARIELDGSTPAGSVVPARLASTGTNGRNAVAIAERGIEYLLPNGAPGVTQGATLNVEVTREAIPGVEPWKRPLGRVTQSTPVTVFGERPKARDVVFPAQADQFRDLGWDDLIDQARTGVVPFAGGELRVSSTPAMTLIDIDGYLSPDELAVLGAAEAAATVRRLDIGGSIGIDLPTAEGKAIRQAAAEAIDAGLPKPFERTAVNGFGFVQIVRPRLRASLVELALDRPSFEARAILRRAAVEGAGGKRLVAHHAVIAVLERHSQWIDALAAQVGGTIELRSDSALTMSGGYATSL